MQFCNQNKQGKYDSKFDQFMKQHQQTMSEEEKQKRIKDAQQELDEVAKKAQMEKEQAEQKLKSTKKAFEDFSSKGTTEEMNLKDVFKNINLKNHLSEAGSMFKGAASGAGKRVNSILEMRKQLFKKEKQEEVEKIIKEEIDKTRNAQEKGKEKEGEEATQPPHPEAEAKEEPEAEPKPSKLSSIKSKLSSTGTKINEKMPFVYKTGVYFKDLWQETFPSDDRKVKTRIERRREIAKVQQNYTEEEIAEMQEAIPEWKRTAVTAVDEDQVQEEKTGFFRRLTRKIGSKVSDTTIAKKIVESEEYRDFKKKYREIKQEASEFKEDFKDEVETTQNPLVGKARSMGDYIFHETELSQAIGKMRMYDPEFDILDLHYEIEEIFTDMFDNYLEGDLEYLQKFWGEAALAVIKTELQRRKKEGWEHKYKELIFCTDANLLAGSVSEDNRPRFSFTLSAQDINCKVSTKNPEEIVEGGDHQIEKAVYKITVRRHDEPDMATTGHYWEVVEFEKYEAVKQIV